ncbi:MAG: PAS domain S-box protein [Chloroflexota bacterium]|nr:PAS domain S-box protein [Chloroflexota bacterium]
MTTLHHLDAIRPEADHVLQQLVDEVRSIFGTDICMVNLNLSDVQYFRAWSGELPGNLAEARQDALENSMCQYVVSGEMPLVVEDFLATEEFREQHWCVNYGIHFYAGTPLITSGNQAIGTLCLLNSEPIEFGQDQMRVLGGFAQAVVGRLELVAALGREQASREEETQRSEERQRTLDSLSAHIAIIDESGTIVAVNKAWRDFARENGVAGQNYAEGANYLRACNSATGEYSEEAAPFAEGIRSVLSGRRERFELEYPCHSPSERRWFIARVTPFAAGGPPRAVIAHENITERKLAEEMLHESERQFRAVFENTLDAILIADDAGEYVGANDAACELFGVTLDELLGAKVEDFVRPGEEHQTRLAWQSFLEQGEQEGEFPLYRPDGETRELEFKAKAGFLPGRHLSVLRDVTERKRAEEALRESNRRIVRILESITDAFFALDREWRFTYLNGQAEHVLQRTREELLGSNMWNEFPEAVNSTLYEKYHEAVATGNSVHFEEFYAPLNTWVEVHAYPSEGGLSVYFQDITERKRAQEELRESQEALRKSEEFHRFAVEAGRIGTWDLDLQTEECLISPKMADLMGFSPDQTTVPDAQWRESIVPDDRTLMASALAASIESDAPFDLEFRIALKDGTERWLYSRGGVTRDASGKALRVHGASIDVTERRAAEEALRESEATLNSILNSLAEGVLVADAQGRVVFVNSAARTILGVTDEEPLDELPDPWEGFNLPEAVAHCTNNGEGIEAGVRYGETFLRVKLECLAGSEQSRGEVLVVIQDLSAGHQLEANQQRFLANAAHQLRTPIMAIVGAAELLATGEDADPAIKRRLLNHIFSEGRRMQRLSDTLLRLSRIGWDRREPELEIVGLREAGQRVAELMEPLAESAGLRILVEGEDTRVHADSEWLQEVLLVLLSNAIKHSSRGGDIKVRIRSGVITVKDEGTGISPADLPHIFERFYRGRGSSEGFGLGLSICKELTERMGGAISIRSREGVGTTVEIKLPEASVEAGVDAQHTDR